MSEGIYLLAFFIILISFFAGISLFIKNTLLRNALSWAIPLISILVPLSLHSQLSPGIRLFVSTVLLLYCLKFHILLKRTHDEVLAFSKVGILIYLTIWPGMDPAPFLKTGPTQLRAKRAVIGGSIFMILGLVLIFLIARNALNFNKELLSWAGIVSLLLTIHFGLSHVLTGAMWFLGWNVKPLFVNPMGSLSLRDFWSHRWNRAFVEMNHLIFIPLCRQVVSNKFVPIGVFVISGLLHEYALSFPGYGCYGGPLLYFIIHGAIVTLESTLLNISHWKPPIKILWVYSWIFIPLPLLFHDCFRHRIILPFFFYLHGAFEL